MIGNTIVPAISPTQLSDNIQRVRESIAAAATRSGRQPGAITLVAVSKTHTPEVVVQAALAGMDVFGENRVQEAEEKIPRVHEMLGWKPTWHLIGTLQRNKVNLALRRFDVIESVDSLRLAEAISARAAEANVQVLLEVYLGDDPDRPGFRPAELRERAEDLLRLPGLDVRGLMTVAPFGWSLDAARDVFAKVRGLRDELAGRFPNHPLKELSMGMTDDYPIAIEEGATIVRVGRAIFGSRPR
jgi:hypothetical protein